MNEFIVWDKTLECFSLSDYVKLENGILKPIGEDYTIYKGIGLKDINGKNIYVDCSIVEFEYRPIGESRNCKDIGFIFWCKEEFMYKINILTKVDRHGDDYIFDLGKSLNRMYMKRITIIDTIQENKLGLIK